MPAAFNKPDVCATGRPWCNAKTLMERDASSPSIAQSKGEVEDRDPLAFLSVFLDFLSVFCVFLPFLIPVSVCIFNNV